MATSPEKLFNPKVMILDFELGRQNNMVKSWLINSMTNEIGENFLLYKTAKEMWDAVKETYFTKENTAEQVDIETVLHDLRQGDLTVTNYYNILARHWQKLDVYEEYDWNCPEDAAKYKKIVEKRRLFKFLLGSTRTLMRSVGGSLVPNPFQQSMKPSQR